MTPDQHEQELKMLFQQWLEGDIDETGMQRLAELANEQELTGAWQSMLAAVHQEPYAEEEGKQHHAILDKVYQNLVATEPGLQRPATIRRMNNPMKYAAAVVLLLMMAGGYYFFRTNQQQQNNAQLSNTEYLNTSFSFGTATGPYLRWAVENRFCWMLPEMENWHNKQALK